MIKKETFNFLKDLIDNNNRDWFQDNKSRYEEAKQNVEEFADEILKEIKKIDLSIPSELPGKKTMMRIYRDVRFSKNKLPYKNNFGIGISSAGKGGDTPGYYIHIQPGESFVAGGYWMPQADHLKAIRQEIDYNTQDLLKIIEAKEFMAHFGGLSQQDKLKTTPKGYDADHDHIELLRLKSFTVSEKFKDSDLSSSKSVQLIIASLKQIFPLTLFLKQAIGNG
ncbi:DUF2461 domain-containing protein [Pedobacter sp. SD-b]|uniref:DUF2461 domain-containing protein n=1 Tax=Pedobacter segetis TaxID=2793069 RepID=A0ABS1BKQ1_9SPHI|nr:DUF2461 domain-containing protein [Pedobacter segetis]MBK0383352.1 DUF2461 domain-containing protein [Pedobacter segetis]